jgi:hypothetical protein
MFCAKLNDVLCSTFSDAFRRNYKLTFLNQSTILETYRNIFKEKYFTPFDVYSIRYFVFKSGKNIYLPI